MLEPPTASPSLSPAEMQILVARAGLLLNPGQVADLVLAWRQVAALIATIPHNRPLADDMAVSFRLPPPVAAAPEAAKPAGRTKAAPPARSAAKTVTSGRNAAEPAVSGRKAAPTADSTRNAAHPASGRKVAKPTVPTRKAAASHTAAKPAGTGRNATGRIAPKTPRGR
ncbi:MAG: hypothetical protein P4L71_12070 [Acetobacteraceae bacterium]|nr:hypothetical protein [Acetobacteraceae bacterium]